MRARARVCMRMCFVLQVLGHVLHGAGAHVCRAPGAGAHVGLLQVLGQVLQVLGLGLGQGFLRSSLFTHPQNFIAANPGHPGASK